MLNSAFISLHPLLADIFVSPGPIIFQWGFLTVRWYGLLIASAVIIGVNLSQYLAKHRGINPLLIQKLVIWLVVAAIPCARLYYVIFQWSDYVNNPGDILAVWKGGDCDSWSNSGRFGLSYIILSLVSSIFLEVSRRGVSITDFGASDRALGQLFQLRSFWFTN